MVVDNVNVASTVMLMDGVDYVDDVEDANDVDGVDYVDDVVDDVVDSVLDLHAVNHVDAVGCYVD